MYYTPAAWVPRCTILRHPDGGYTPVLHPCVTLPPACAAGAISFPDLGQAVQYARDHYGSVLIVVDDEQHPGAA